MMHKAWCSIEEVSYCFSRSSIKFQSHAGLEITRSFEMMHNAWPTWNARISVSANRERPLNLNHSLKWIVWVAPVPLMIFQSNSTFDEKLQYHYNDVLMGAIASQITSLTIVYSTVYSDADQRKHQSSASLAFVRGIHRGPVNSPHKWPVTRKMFPFDDVIMYWIDVCNISWWSSEYVMNRSVTKFHSPK